MNTELRNYIESNKYILPYTDIESGYAEYLKNLGLNNLLVCFVGRGRSPAVAELLCACDKPAIALEGGSREVDIVGKHDKHKSGLSVFMYISCIFDWAERRQFKNQIGLDIYRYFDHPDVAFHTLRKLKQIT